MSQCFQYPCVKRVSLLPKKDKNPLTVAVSLLNTDTKILANILAKRLQQAIPHIVSPDQTGFVKNVQSFFNIRQLFNILYAPTLPSHKDE